MRSLWMLALAPLFWACPDPPADAPPPAAPPAETPPVPPPPMAGANQDGPDWKSAFKHAVRYDAARKAVVVDVKIQPGFHAYTIGETIGRPMNVTLDEASAYSHAGEVQYPKGETKDLPIGRSVIVEGDTEIVAPVEKKKAATANAASGTFKWQVCTDEACDRPRSEPFTIDVPGA